MSTQNLQLFVKRLITQVHLRKDLDAVIVIFVLLLAFDPMNIMLSILVDPEQCEILDCTKDLAKEMCPKTCTEPKYCTAVNCAHPKSIKHCPKTCTESINEDTGKKSYKMLLAFKRLIYYDRDNY